MEITSSLFFLIVEKHQEKQMPLDDDSNSTHKNSHKKKLSASIRTVLSSRLNQFRLDLTGADLYLYEKAARRSNWSELKRTWKLPGQMAESYCVVGWKCFRGFVVGTIH